MTADKDNTGFQGKPEITHLHKLGRLMDESIRLPGGYRIGWDGVIGLVPGIGDAVGLVVSVYIIVSAARLGVSRSVLIRMCTNVAMETVIGLIPLAGDLFDFMFKANTRNLALFDASQQSPATMRRWSIVWLLLVTMLMLLIVSLPVYLLVRLMITIAGAF